MIYRNITPWLCIDEILNISYSTHTDTRMVYYFFKRMNISSYVTVQVGGIVYKTQITLKKGQNICVYFTKPSLIVSLVPFSFLIKTLCPGLDFMII